MPNKAPDENENIGMPIYFPLYQKEEMNKNWNHEIATSLRSSQGRVKVPSPIRGEERKEEDEILTAS